jgi:hypothetical protein
MEECCNNCYFRGRLDKINNTYCCFCGGGVIHKSEVKDIVDCDNYTPEYYETLPDTQFASYCI